MLICVSRCSMIVGRDVQAALQRAKNAQANRLALRQALQATSRHQQTYAAAQQDTHVGACTEAAISKGAKLGASIGNVLGFPTASPAEPEGRGLAAVGGRGTVRLPQLPRLPNQAVSRRPTAAPGGSHTARDLPETIVQQPQHHHEQLLLRSAEAPYLHLLLENQDVSKKKDRRVSLRGMAAAMQASVSHYPHK